MNILMDMLTASWHVYNASALYMLLGFFVAGLLHAFVSADNVGKYLGTGRIRPVILAALAGIPIPLCSCGVIPAAAGLKRQGANNGATLSFLISTPETGVDSIPVTYALMGPLMAILRPISAFITAVAAGIAENLFGTRTVALPPPPAPMGCGCSGCADTIGPGNPPAAGRFAVFRRKIGAGLGFAFGDLLEDIAGYFLLGILIAGLIEALVPADLIAMGNRNPLVSMLVMLAAGIPMYVCATSSTPIAAALILKGLNPGAALVFLLAGPATNAASLSMVSGLLGKRALAIYLGAIVTCSLVLGLLTDLLYAVTDYSFQPATGPAETLLPPLLHYGAAAILGLLIVRALVKWYKRGAEAKTCGQTVSQGGTP